MSMSIEGCWCCKKRKQCPLSIDIEKCLGYELDNLLDNEDKNES